MVMVAAPDRLLGARELMDQPGTEIGELAWTLKDLARINHFLGGRRLICGQLASLLPDLPAPTRILDVATGYADIPRAVIRWAGRRGFSLAIEALDHDDRILKLAGLATAAYPEIHFQHGNALALPYPDRSFDIVLASLVLHHMEGEEPVRLLRELYRVARRAVVVNDLRRGRLPFLAGWAGLHLVSRNRLIHHDGPLSFRRGFLPAELLALAREAGWARIRVSRHAFFRLALVGEKA